MNIRLHESISWRKVWSNITIALLILLLPISPYGLTAQQGTLTVTVVDTDGEVVAGSVVTLTNIETNRSLRQETNANGVAVFNNLPVGTYRARVSARGFATQISEDIAVGVGQAQSIMIPITTGAVNRLILPSDTTTSVDGGEAPSELQEDLAALPNLNNDLTPILQVVPGALATGSASLGRIIIDGKGRDQQTNWLDRLDVTPLADLPAGDPAIAVFDGFLKPSVALEKATPVTGAFEPFYGPGTGTVIDGVTLQGKSDNQGFKNWRFQFHESLRNDALDARNFFDYDGKNAIRRSMFGGKLGGSIVPGRSFFFVAYEGVRGRTERNIYEAVPVSALCHCGTGSPLSPVLGGFLPAGTQVIDGASLNPDFVVARRRVRINSEANSFDLRFDFTPFAGAKIDNTNDDAPHAKNSFTFRLTHQAAEFLVPDGVTGRRQRQQLILANALAKASLFTTNYSHEFRFGINQTRGRMNTEVLPSTDASLAQSLITTGGTVKTAGLPGDPQSVPVATLGGLVKNGGRGFNLNPISTIAGYDFFRTMKGGAHQLRFGVETRFIQLDFDRLGGLTYAFSDAAALRAGTPASVTYLSDMSEQSPFARGTGVRRAKQEYYMGYVQMVSKFWKSGAPRTSDPRLIITYGLRYDYFGAVRERDNRAVVVDPETGAILPPGTPFYRARKDNFEPRVGLSYRLPFENGFLGNSVLNAGAGVYSGSPRIGDLLLPIESDRFSTGTTAGVSFPMSAADVVRGFTENPETRQFQPIAFARDFTTPERAYKWQASFTKTLEGIYDFSVAYNGNVGRNLPLAGIANRIISVVTNTDPTKSAVVVREFDIVRAGQVFKPYGEFFYRTSAGRSSYNGLTISLGRNKATETSLPRWLNPNKFNLQYTLSRSVGNVSGTLASDPFNFDSDYGYNANDARHSFSFSSVFRLWEQFASRKKSDMLMGWTIAPQLSARSGLPLVVRLDRPDVVYLDASGNVFATPAVGRRAVINTPGGGATGGARVPDLIPGVNPYLRNGVELLNPAAFAIPEPGRLGNLKRGALRGLRAFQVDLALTRHLFEKEQLGGVTADFKIEFINLFNRANLNNPTASLPNSLGTTPDANEIQPNVPFNKLSAGSFGIVNAADAGRVVQFTLILKFNNGF